MFRQGRCGRSLYRRASGMRGRRQMDRSNRGNLRHGGRPFVHKRSLMLASLLLHLAVPCGGLLHLLMILLRYGPDFDAVERPPHSGDVRPSHG